MASSAEFIASDPNIVLELLAHSLTVSERSADAIAVVAQALAHWLKFDSDGSRAAVKDELLTALSLPEESLQDVAPDDSAPPLVKHEDHALTASARSWLWLLGRLTWLCLPL